MRHARKPLSQIDEFVAKHFRGGKRGLGKLVSSINLGGKRSVRYLGTLLKDPHVAALHPSSKYVVNRVVRAMNLRESGVIVEFGAAEGVITHKILTHMRSGAKLIAIERNRDFYETLKSIKDPRLIPVHGDVREFCRILDSLGVVWADCVVSGIPFSFLSAAERKELLRGVYSRLSSGGRFVAYQFTTHLVSLIKKQFPVTTVEFEPRNLPPHFIFTAIKK